MLGPLWRPKKERKPYAFGRLPWFAFFLRRSLRLRPRLLMVYSFRMCATSLRNWRSEWAWENQ